MFICDVPKSSATIAQQKQRRELINLKSLTMHSEYNMNMWRYGVQVLCDYSPTLWPEMTLHTFFCRLIIILVLWYPLQSDAHKDVWMYVVFASNDAFTLKTSLSWNDELSEQILYVTILVKKVFPTRIILLSSTQTDPAGYTIYLSCVASIFCFYNRFSLHPGWILSK